MDLLGKIVNSFSWETLEGISKYEPRVFILCFGRYTDVSRKAVPVRCKICEDKSCGSEMEGVRQIMGRIIVERSLDAPCG